MGCKIIHTVCPAEHAKDTIRIDYSCISSAGSHEVSCIKDGFSCEHMQAGQCASSLSDDFECPVYVGCSL